MKLTEVEQLTLREAYKNHPTHRCRQRAHYLLLSYKHYPIKEVANIHDVAFETVSSCIDRWERIGLRAIYDEPRSGRPPILSEVEVERLKDLIDEEPHQTKRAHSLLQKETLKTFSLSMLTRLLKTLGYSYKRARLSLKGKRNEVLFRRCQKILNKMIKLEKQDKMTIYYFDESGFSQKSNLPYAWTPVNQPLERQGHSRSKRLNVLGFLSREGELIFHATEGSVKTTTVIEAFEKMIEAKPPERIVAVILDNASMHCSKLFRAKCFDWMAHNVFVHYLPPYSPELNVIEILWKKMKYEWLETSAFESFEKLKSSVKNILCNYGTDFQITFS